MGIIFVECKACFEERSRRVGNNNNGSSSNNIKGNKGTKVNVSYNNGGGNGSSCYSCSAKINQRPETGRDDFRIQINAQHHGDHSCDEQILTMVFNYPVNFISCSNGSINSSNNSTRIQVKLRYHNNPNDNIVMGDFIVKSSHNDLQIVNCFINDGH